MLEAERRCIDDPTHKGYPTLILGPPNIVHQWANEISRITNRIQIYLYYGDPRDSKSQFPVLPTLSQHHQLFDGNKKNLFVVIISSYPTWNSRHGPSHQAIWQQDPDPNRYNKLDPAWPRNLSGKFHTLVLDEAHILRNLDTQSSSAVGWINADFNLLLTATPCYTGLDDFLGIAPYILHPANDTLLENNPPPKDWDILSVDPAYKHVIFSLTGLHKYVFENVLLKNHVKGQLLRRILSECMIRRSLSSQIPFQTGDQIGSSIPPSQSKNVKIQFSESKQKHFKRM